MFRSQVEFYFSCTTHIRYISNTIPKAVRKVNVIRTKCKLFKFRNIDLVENNNVTNLHNYSLSLTPVDFEIQTLEL